MADGSRIPSDHPGNPRTTQVCPLRCPGLGSSFAVHWCHVVALDSVRGLPTSVGVIPMIRSEPSVYQTSHALLCRLLHQILMDAVQAGCGAAGGIGSVPLRASAALYALLLAHPLDQQGRCRACRGPGAVFGRRRRCWVHLQANYWLRQPEEFLYSRVADEWGPANPPPPSAGAAPGGTAAATQPAQTPVAPPAPIPPVGRPDLDHGEAGDDPDGPRSRRGPSDDPGPSAGPDVLPTGGPTWSG